MAVNAQADARDKRDAVATYKVQLAYVTGCTMQPCRRSAPATATILEKAMSKYTAEQARDLADRLERNAQDKYGALHGVQCESAAIMLRDYAALLRERESAKAAVTDAIKKGALQLAYYGAEYAYRHQSWTIEAIQDGCKEHFNSWLKQSELVEAVAPMLASARVPDETRGTYACPICGKEYPHYHPEDTSRVNWHSDYRKIFEDIISANVRLYKDGVSIAPTNYSHESKLTVAGMAGHWFAYGAEDARSFGRESKGTDSAAWSEFASNGDGYAYAWMDSLWSLFKQTVVALKGREAVAPMLASAGDTYKIADSNGRQWTIVGRAPDGDGFIVADDGELGWVDNAGKGIVHTNKSHYDIELVSTPMLASARVPDFPAFVSILREAAEILSAIEPGKEPANMRWLIADELSGFAYALAAAPKTVLTESMDAQRYRLIRSGKSGIPLPLGSEALDVYLDLKLKVAPKPEKE